MTAGSAVADRPGGTPDRPPRRAGIRQWAGLAIMVVPLFMLSTDITALFLTMPSISADLAPTGAQSLWILHVGEFLTASTIITFGLLVHRLGARRLLLTSVAGYGSASLLAAYAVNAEMLIGSRALLGVAAAGFAPAGIALIRTTFRDPRQYSVAFAVFMAAFAGGAAAGPPFSGLILEHFWWGGVFLINVPIAAVLLVAGPLLLPRDHADRTVRIDTASAGLSVVAIISLVYGLQEMADRGIRTAPAASALLGVGLLIAFVRRQRRISSPLMDLSLFRNHQFSILLVIIFVLGFGTAATDMLLAQYLQVVRAMTPLEVGLLLLAPAVGTTVGTMATPLLSRQGDPMVPSILVLALSGVSALAIIPLIRSGDLLLFVIALSLFGLLGAPFVTLASQMVISAAPADKTGPATAIQEVNSGLGIGSSLAFLGAGALAIYRIVLRRDLPEDIDPAAADAASDSFGGSPAIARSLDPSEMAHLTTAVETAFTGATQFVYAAAAAVSFLVAGAVLLLRSRLFVTREVNQVTGEVS